MEEAGNAIEHLALNIERMSDAKSILIVKHKVLKQTYASHDLDVNKSCEQ